VAVIVAEAQAAMEAFFARSLTKGQAIGEFPDSLEPQAMARLLLAMYLGLRVLSRSRPDPALLQSIANEALKRLEFVQFPNRESH